MRYLVSAVSVVLILVLVLHQDLRCLCFYYQYEQMSTRLKSYAIATVFVFLVSFIGPNKPFFNAESVFKFLNHEFNPIQDGHFWDCLQMGEGGWAKRPPSLKSVTHILQWYNWAVIPYLRKIPKNIWTHNAPPELCWHQQFFTRNQQILLYQEI